MLDRFFSDHYFVVYCIIAFLLFIGVVLQVYSLRLQREHLRAVRAAIRAFLDVAVKTEESIGQSSARVRKVERILERVEDTGTLGLEPLKDVLNMTVKAVSSDLRSELRDAEKRLQQLEARSSSQAVPSVSSEK